MPLQLSFGVRRLHGRAAGPTLREASRVISSEVAELLYDLLELVAGLVPVVGMNRQGFANEEMP